MLRCTAFEARHEPDVIAADLLAVGVPRVVSALERYSDTTL